MKDRLFVTVVVNSTMSVGGNYKSTVLRELVPVVTSKLGLVN